MSVVQVWAMKYHQETRPCLGKATDMARTQKLRTAPLGRGSCTAVHRLPDIQRLPHSTYSLRYPDSQLGAGGCSQRQQTRPPRARARRRGSVVTQLCQKNCWEGNAQVGFVSSSSVSRDSEKVCQVYTTQQPSGI